jgi:hypothetical protein
MVFVLITLFYSPSRGRVLEKYLLRMGKIENTLNLISRLGCGVIVIHTIRAGFGVERVEHVSGLEINDEPNAGNDRKVVPLPLVLDQLKVP